MAVFSRHAVITLVIISTIVVYGTVSSVRNNTFLDTSNPLLAHLPHPSHGKSYFASKKNIFNQVFVKKAWGWTSAAFWAVWLTADEHGVAGGVKTIDAIGKWVTTTAVWMAFAAWFFGPSLFSRIGAYSGAECVIQVPHTSSLDGTPAAPHLITIPATFCEGRIAVSPETHPALFASPPSSGLVLEEFGLQPGWKVFPKMYRGHDVSGHTFLLALSTLFLVDALVRARKGRLSGSAIVSQLAAWLLVGLWLVMLGTTALYFHTWDEKITGLLIAILGYVVSQAPFEAISTPAASQTKTSKDS
ncbi:hypothetical protein FRB99_003030 [Tulasnella sp. 403]|nr:hypothetical protein FRB99_003030 [Tulasnella sp. 403]